MSDTLEDMMRKLGAGGWAGFDEEAMAKVQAGELRAERDQMLAEAAVVRRCLANPEGEAFLLWLLKKTLMRPPNAQEQAPSTAEMYAIAKARREGQNAILFTILDALAVTGKSVVAVGKVKAPRSRKRTP